MKRVVIILLAFLVVLLFASCSSSAVKEVETAIDRIADTPIESKAEAIKSAEEAYNNLSEKQQKSVRNYDMLKKAKIFVVASEAFQLIDNANKDIEVYGADIYEAWLTGITDTDKVKKEGISYLSKDLEISEEDLYIGLAILLTENLEDFDWDNSSDDKKEQIYEIVKTPEVFDFVLYLSPDKNDIPSICVNVVVRAYKHNGSTDKIQENMNEAKIKMKEMSEKYSDYEHYSSLKNYYTTANAFFEFCLEPSGSFEQFKDTVNEYKNDARKYRNDLAYIFED